MCVAAEWRRKLGMSKGRHELQLKLRRSNRPSGENAMEKVLFSERIE